MTASRPTTQPALPASLNRGGLALPLALLFISALPDAMVVPVLHDLTMQRYDVSAAAAHAFMCLNLVGALAVVGVIGRLRRHGRDRSLVTVAALLNGLLLATMALPIGFMATLAVRLFEGAADLVVYAFLFDLVARIGPAATKGRRMGAAATCLMLGVACGIGVGGGLGSVDPVLSLWFGALACLIVSVAALRLRTSEIRSTVRNSPDHGPERHAVVPLWPALVMMFSDRAVVGVLVSTVPLFLSAHAGLGNGMIGGVIGMSMLMTAVGAWPAGMLAERIGPLRLRLVAGAVFALTFACLVPSSLGSVIALTAALLCFGAAGAVLFAASLSIVVQSRRGPAGMAAYHAAGNLGFLFGPTMAGLTLKLAGSADAGLSVYAGLTIAVALLHGTGTFLGVIGASVSGRTTGVRPESGLAHRSGLAVS